jgi:Xaa-Pro dipeptidase
MSKHDFSLAEFDSRRERVRQALSSAGLDWLVAFHPVTIHWLTGSDAKSYQEFQCLLFSADEGRVILFAREGERNELEDDALFDELYTFNGGEPEDPLLAFQEAARALNLFSRRLGVERPAYYLHPEHDARLRALLGDAIAADATNLVHDLKLVKSPAELQYIRRAGQIADEAMKVFAESLRPGKTELAVAAETYRGLLSAGSGLAASPMNLVSGERSCYSHGAPTERPLRAGDYGHVEYGAAYKRYTATIGRQFCIGAPTARMQELYDVVRQAQDACFAEIRDGAAATAPHEAAKAVIAGAGLDHARVHTTGYGLAPGFPPSWAEPLHLFGGSQYTLRAGMVVTVEPAVFLHDERLGARLIDNVLVTETGGEWLTGFGRDLIVVEI